MSDEVPTTPASAADEPATAPTPPSRGRIAIVAVLLVVALAVPAVLAAGGGDDAADALPPRGTLDGVLVQVEATRLVLEPSDPVDGARRVEFVVPPGRTAALDLPHLQEHAADGLPTRVAYVRRGEDLVAQSAVDAPVRP